MNLSTPFVIETDALSKAYKRIQALRSLDLKVHQNSIFGFLGLNGAGKTTTIHPPLELLEPGSTVGECVDHRCCSSCSGCTISTARNFSEGITRSFCYEQA